MNLRIVIRLTLMLAAVPAYAQSPEEVLALCRRDTKNALQRLQGGQPAAGARTLQSVVDICGRGPKAEAIKALPGYADFLKEFEEAKAVLEGLAKAADSQQNAARQSAFSAAPGGDPLTVRARWKTMPEHCAPPSWQTIDGVHPIQRAAKPAPAARIAGLDEAVPGGVDPRIFEDAAHRPAVMTADDWVARLACGFGVEGVDPWFTEKSLLGSIASEDDPRSVLARALGKSQADPAQRALWSAALGGQCFAASEWDVKKDYLRYLFCLDALPSVPGEAEVASAAAAAFPGGEWEKANLAHLAKKGAAARDAVVAAFTRAEAAFPMMKAVYRDTAVAAREAYRKRRAQYAEAYRVLDPFTAQVIADPGVRMPGCLPALQGLRDQLAAEVKPASAESVAELRAGHPLGYQISEVLGSCYLGEGLPAHALVELNGLALAQRRVTEEESIWYAREAAAARAEKELGAKDRVEKAIPNLAWGRAYGVPVPASLGTLSRLLQRLGNGVGRRIGDSDSIPADIAALKQVPGGVEVHFNQVTYPFQPISCRDTNQVDRYDVIGNQIRPVYRQECSPAGKVQMRTHQEKPVVVPKPEATRMKVGLRVILFASQDGGDVAVEKLWVPKGKVLVDGGITLAP